MLRQESMRRVEVGPVVGSEADTARFRIVLAVIAGIVSFFVASAIGGLLIDETPPATGNSWSPEEIEVTKQLFHEANSERLSAAAVDCLVNHMVATYTPDDVFGWSDDVANKIGAELIKGCA
jgi:hypothetical protein